MRQPVYAMILHDSMYNMKGKWQSIEHNSEIIVIKSGTANTDG